MITKFIIGNRTYIVQMNGDQINKFYELIKDDVENQADVIQLGSDLLVSGKLDKALSYCLVIEGSHFTESSAIETEKIIMNLNSLQKFQIVAEVLNQIMESFGIPIFDLPLNKN